jgi:hypothetical protein
MAKIPFDIRHKRVTTITGSEGIFIDVDGDDVPQRITIDDIRPIIATATDWGDIGGTLSSQTDLQTTLNGKQDTLVSATNIKTINGSSVLGSGDLVVSGSGASWGSITGTLSSQTDLQTALDGKVNDTGNETIAGDKTFSGKLIMSGDILQVKDYDTTGSYISFDDATNTEVGGIYHDATGDLVDIYATKELRLESNTEIVFASPTINMATSSKVTPLDADTVYIKDTSSVNEVKQTTWSNVKLFLKTYFDTLYQVILVSGTNIKTVNGTTLLGSGDLPTPYTLSVQALTSSPADGATIYFGQLPKAPTTTANISKVYIPKTGTIKRVNIYCYSGTAGTAENWSAYIRLNNTTDTLIETIGASTNERIFNNESLNISVVAGDYIEIKMINPTWATNPATTIFGGYIYIE